MIAEIAVVSVLLVDYVIQASTREIKKERLKNKKELLDNK